MEIGLLLLRLGVGLTLAAHGAQKLFGWFGGHGLEATGKVLETLGFQPGRRKALMAGLAEFGGGVLLALGFITPLAGALFVGVMLVALVSAHARKGFFATAGGYEYVLVLAVSGLTPAFTGPGRLSLDSLLGLRLDGALWGAAAAIVGLMAGAIELGSRRSPQAPEPANAPMVGAGVARPRTDFRKDTQMPASTKTTAPLWIAQSLLAALFLFAGAMKFIMPLKALHLPVPVGLLYFIGGAEILGALGLVLPGLLNVAWALTPVAAVGLVTIMAGATTITVEGGQVAPALIPFAIGVLAATVAYGRRAWLAVARPSSIADIPSR